MDHFIKIIFVNFQIELQVLDLIRRQMKQREAVRIANFDSYVKKN